MGADQLFSNLLTVGVLVTLGIIIYLKVTNRTLVELFREIKELTAPAEEVTQ